MSVLMLAVLASAAETRRFAVVAGANDGGPERVELRWAASDAREVAGVLTELGGVAPQDELVLVDPGADVLAQGLVDVAARVRAARTQGLRTELVVYYSGHSDDDGLLLGRSQLSYADLRADVAAIPADVRVVILDSCSSGSITQSKGGVSRAAFLLDESVDVTGSAYLTSSAPDESAQESDRVTGSFFTHYLVSGLRGAADRTSDGRVTLGEAYQFAYDETLARTQRTLGGAQHPAFDIQMAGTGDLVMTDLASTSALLHAGPELEGRLYITDSSHQLVAELLKVRGREVSLGLTPGAYTILIEAPTGKEEGRFELVDGQTLELADVSFHHLAGEVATARGGDLVDVPLSLGLLPGLEVPVPNGPSRKHTAISFGVDHASELQGAQIALVGSQVSNGGRGVQLATVWDQTGGPFSGVQASAAVDVATGTLHGVQAAAGVAAANEIHGLQMAPGVAYAKEMHGLQSSAGAAVAVEANGAQLAPINVVKHVKGAQIGVINVADEVDGTQIGVINIADHVSGQPLGLITINRSGYNHLWGWAGDEPLNLGLSYGGTHLFTSLEAGVWPGTNGRFTALLGLGWHAGSRVFVDTGVSSGSAQGFPWPYDRTTLLVRARSVIGVQLVKGFAPFVGPTLSLAPWSLRPGASYPTPLPAVDLGSGRGRVPMWFGFAAGVRI